MIGPAHVQAASSALARRRGRNLVFFGLTFIDGKDQGFVREELVHKALHLFDNFLAAFDRVLVALEPNRLVEGRAD